MLGFLEGVLPSIRATRIAGSFGSGEEVACRFDLETAAGVIPVFDYFRVQGGEIRQIRPFFDPRPLVTAGA